MKKNLVISTVGDSSLHNNWSSPNPDYDTYLVNYGSLDYEGQSEFYLKTKGYKYPLLLRLLEENQWILRDYEYVWLPDDDIYTSHEDICRLFCYMREYDLWLAQPSVWGWYSIDAVVHRWDSILRYTNWVEIMCPCFSAPALRTCLPVFGQNKTGWGIDAVWNVLLDHPRDKIAIIDAVAVLHTRQVLTGDTYAGQGDPFGFAMSECAEVYEKFKLDEEFKKDEPFGESVLTQKKHVVMYGQIKRPYSPSGRTSQMVTPFAGAVKRITDLVRA